MGRSPRNLRPDLNGLLVIDKDLGQTSAGVCREVRRRTGGAKVGHAGTLDPLATGVLVVCLGAATKLVPRLMAARKRYDATIDLSAFSTTDDGEGDLTPVEVAEPPITARVDKILATFLGPIQQRPPAYSALKRNGRPAYARARAGEFVELEPREVLIHTIERIHYAWPRLDITVTCGKGTYIRSLARDVGAALGTGGRLAALRRTAVGEFTIGVSRSLDKLPASLNAQDLREPSESLLGA